jgi:hypothetical protein
MIVEYDRSWWISLADKHLRSGAYTSRLSLSRQGLHGLSITERDMRDKTPVLVTPLILVKPDIAGTSVSCTVSSAGNLMKRHTIKSSRESPTDYVDETIEGRFKLGLLD